MNNQDVAADGKQDHRIPLWVVEVGCWTTVLLAPFLYWVNGPAVSTDQLVMRIVVLGLALLGGIAIRSVRWQCRRSVTP